MPGECAEAGVFLPYEAIVDRLESTAKQIAGASVIHRGGLAILKLGAEASGVNHSPREVWLQGGIHACEWLGPAVVLRLMDELVQNSALRRRATWYLLPVVDVQGYQRTWSGERFRRTADSGENPNMNFPFRWGKAPLLLRLLLGRKLRRWMGPHPASVDCVKSLVAELKSLRNLQLFLDFHSFGRLWLYPWCSSRAPSPHHAKHLAASAIAVAAADRTAESGGYRAQAAAQTEEIGRASCRERV